MIDYDDLRKLAEAAMPKPHDRCTEWYDAPGLVNSLLARIQPIDAPFIATMTPRVALRLLEIIAVAQRQLRHLTCGFDCGDGVCRRANEALNEIAKLENE